MADIGIPLVVRDITFSFMDMFMNPEHGYGSEMNPCIDCRLLTLQTARSVMEETGAEFIITGEVVGQRPMTQNKPTLFHMDRVSGLKGRILRPLSARVLPPTIPEGKGWVNREKLYDITGRGRKRQIEMARELGIHEFSQPAGGCMLTEPAWSARARSLMTNLGRESVGIEDIQLLRLGRHFWPRRGLWVIVGRDEQDNKNMEPFGKGRWRFFPVDVAGPLVLASGIENETDIQTAARLTARYSGGKNGPALAVQYESDAHRGALTVEPVPESLVDAWRVQADGSNR